MRVDIYRRAEAGNRVSYLAVPEGRAIPEEAVNIDLETEASAVDAGEAALTLRVYGIPEPEEQMAEKGYAITSLDSQPPAS
jgi:hypothetical protein